MHCCSRNTHTQKDCCIFEGTNRFMKPLMHFQFLSFLILNNRGIMAFSRTRMIMLVFFLLVASILQVGADRLGVEDFAPNTMSVSGIADASHGNPAASSIPFQSIKRLRTSEKRRLQGGSDNNFMAGLSPATCGVVGGLVFLFLIIFILYCFCGCSLCEILMLFCCYELCCGD